MTIDAMVRSHSDDNQTAFKTTPPLTDEVLEAAIQHYFGTDKVGQFWMHEGLFVVARTSIPKDQLDIYATSLTESEKLVGRTKTNLENAREADLQERARKAGLPLE